MKKPIFILGFDCYGHDAAAALVKDGELIAFAEEERFTREKHTSAYPLNAMIWCCKQAGIEPKTWITCLLLEPLPTVGERARHLLHYFPNPQDFSRAEQGNSSPCSPSRSHEEKTWTFFQDNPSLLRTSPHACSECLSGLALPEAAILSIDAVGEWETTWLGYGRGVDIECLKAVNFPTPWVSSMGESQSILALNLPAERKGHGTRSLRTTRNLFRTLPEDHHMYTRWRF